MQYIWTSLLILNTILLETSGIRWRKFQKSFSIGTATSAYQIEGAWNASDKGVNIWDNFLHNEDGKPIYYSTGDVACDSYNKFERDIRMLREMRVDHYRFSISWSRILPEGSIKKISESGINYYNKLIDRLIKFKIKPLVTIFQWDSPQSLEQFGGWTDSRIIKIYYDYSNLLFSKFGDRVKFWITFNNPYDFCNLGHGKNELAPKVTQKEDERYLCAHNILKAHGRAFRNYDKNYRSTQKGKITIGLNAIRATPTTIDKNNIDKHFQLDWFANPIYSIDGDYPKAMKDLMKPGVTPEEPLLPIFTKEDVEIIKGSSDLFGLNHYSSGKYPSYFTDLLNAIRLTYNNPEIFILENGYPVDEKFKDTRRIDYMQKSINAVLDAVEDGCKITGYTIWSLMDSFEWNNGYTQKFGLYHVDFNNPRRTRTPRLSSRFVRKLTWSRSIKQLTRSNN